MYKRQVQGRLQYDEFYALKDVSLDIMPCLLYTSGEALARTVQAILQEREGKV